MNPFRLLKGNLEERDYWKDVNVGGSIALKWILEK
jgi:hypothetical protein